jgi:hypothetical protein
MAYLFPAASVAVTKVASVTIWQNLHPTTDGPYGVPRTKHMQNFGLTNCETCPESDMIHNSFQ